MPAKKQISFGNEKQKEAVLASNIRGATRCDSAGSNSGMADAPDEYPQAVCFDLYGTLVDISIDTKSGSVWNAFSAELLTRGIQRNAAELHARYDELTERERREYGAAFVLDSSFFFKLLNAREPEDISVVQHFGRRFRALSTRELTLKPYAVPLLKQLRKRGCKLAIVSNTEATLTSYDLDSLELGGFFEAIVLSSAVGVKKPNKRIFQIALDRLKAEASRCAFVGDDVECDYYGARSAGIRCVLLCSGRHANVPCVRPDLTEILEAVCGTASLGVLAEQ